MPIDRFYLDSDLTKKETVLLQDAEHHHLSHVMKLSVGETVELIDGKGGLATGKIKEIKKKETHVDILSFQKKPPLSPRLLLAAPLMRPSKLEWVIEKGTELGADQFLLFKADYSEKESLSEHQLERLRNLSIAACKQSGRLYLPSIEVLPDLTSLFTHQALFLFGDTRAVDCKEIPAGDCIAFISGPERGFSKKELQQLDEKAVGIQLSANVLRAETAPIAAISILGRFVI